MLQLKENTVAGYELQLIGPCGIKGQQLHFSEGFLSLLVVGGSFLTFLLKCMIFGYLNCLDKSQKGIEGTWNLQKKKPKSEIKTESRGSDVTAITAAPQWPG